MLRKSSFLLLVAISWMACSEKQEKPETPDAPAWTFESEAAPYRITLDGTWQKEPNVLNEFADLTATHPDGLFFIVIPQLLPQIEGVDTPDALDFKRAGVTLMQEQIGELQIQKQGPIRVDDRQGQSVVARGVVQEDQQVTYVTTYLTDGDWGFQLVGWAPIDSAAARSAP